MLLDQGINGIRTLHYNATTIATFGSSGATVLTTQTGPLAAISGATVTITKATSDKSFQATARLTSVTATGNTIREIGYAQSGPTLYFDREVVPSITHGSNDEVVIIKSYFYKTD